MSTTTEPLTAVPDATADEQLLLVEHLHARLRDQFSGAAPEFEELRGRYPSKVLQLGVIPPLPEPDPDTGETPEQFAKRLRRPPSNIGLDFEVDQAPDGTATVEVESKFSFYIQRYPDRDAQAEFYAGGQEKQTRQEEENPEDPDAKDADAKERVRILPVFKRFEIDSGRVAVELEGDTGEREIDLSPTIAAVLNPVLTDPGTMYPFWAERSQTLPASALNGDQAHFEQAIHEAEGGSRSEPLTAPKSSIVVTWQPSAEGRIRVQATLRNDTLVKLRNQERPKRRSKADGEAKAKRTLPRDMELFNTRLRVFQSVGAFSRIEFRRAPKDFRYADLRHVWAVGRNCHGRRMDVERDGHDGIEEPLTTDHWPVYLQKQMTPRKEKALQLEFSSSRTRRRACRRSVASPRR